MHLFPSIVLLYNLRPTGGRSPRALRPPGFVVQDLLEMSRWEETIMKKDRIGIILLGLCMIIAMGMVLFNSVLS